ncbi:Nramp family divalent metal transporter [candidate division CSSED10-310 bacterium]|uniref:Nramp family divalent metal transporter n=1 Tax=candidate division CSSED10-310 bacterium TaxID=2855610 RepID=A0ABV6YYT2_UNCC1
MTVTTKQLSSLSFLAIMGPGILIAATGVGAGDLASGAFAGSKLGLAVLWAVWLGALLKFIITEGLTRWQLATGQTLLEGAVDRFGSLVQYLFLIYLLCWSFVVGSALISACGVAAHALMPVFDDPRTAKISFGILHSLIGLLFVWLGSFKSFEKVMSACIGMMFVTVIITALLMRPDWSQVTKGMLFPSIPHYIDQSGREQGIYWTLALMGGVGGTLTILCYGYWIRESGRTGVQDLKICRLDLAIAYIMTALFGIAMIIIASHCDLERQASALMVVVLAEQLRDIIGHWGQLIFLIGAWAAVFSSLLGVWQSVPYLFADFWGLFKQRRAQKGVEVSTPIPVDPRGKPYRFYLVALALVPLIGLNFEFELIQKIYAVFGSLVIPLLALLLLIMNGRSNWVGKEHTNRPITVVALIATLLIFLYLGSPKLLSILSF